MDRRPVPPTSAPDRATGAGVLDALAEAVAWLLPDWFGGTADAVDAAVSPKRPACFDVARQADDDDEAASDADGS